MTDLSTAVWNAINKRSLTEECAADLREFLARRKQALMERDEALDAALDPGDWYRRAPTSAKLKCGCEGRYERVSDGESVGTDWIWEKQCAEHGEQA